MIYNEKIYNKDKISPSGQRWRCKDRKCKGSLMLDGDNKVLRSKDHSCSIGQNEVEKILALEKIKEAVNVTNENFNRIYTSVTSELTENLGGILPSFKTLRDNAERKRKKRDSYDFTADQDIPKELQQTLNRKKFLQFDSGVHDNERFIVFMNDDFVKYIKKGTVVILDGTFKAVPNEFYQLVTFQFYICGTFLPLIFILLKQKTETSYYIAFNYLKETFQLKPSYLICDFEKALLNACKTFDDDVKIRGCGFHYSQCLWKKIQTLNLVTHYKENIIFRYIIRMFFNISYIQPDKIYIAYEFIISKIKENNFDIILNEFTAYFENNFIGNKHKMPIYDIEFWSVYDRIKNHIPRTTNSLEGWHRGFNAFVNIRHPNIGKFISCLRIETEKNRMKISRLVTGALELKDKGLKREHKLYIIVQNDDFYDISKLFDIYENINRWKTEE